MKNIEKWLLPFCIMIANGDRCPAMFNGYLGSCDECELDGLCNNTVKLYEYMNKESEGNKKNE